MKIKHTIRGFAILKFKDEKHNKCTLQKSSLMSKECIWLGCEEIGLKKFTPGIGWKELPLENNPPHGILHIANTRMHLTQKQVKKLLPYLQKFVKTGELE